MVFERLRWRSRYWQYVTYDTCLLPFHNNDVHSLASCRGLFASIADSMGSWMSVRLAGCHNYVYEYFDVLQKSGIRTNNTYAKNSSSAIDTWKVPVESSQIYILSATQLAVCWVVTAAVMLADWPCQLLFWSRWNEIIDWMQASIRTHTNTHTHTHIHTHINRCTQAYN